MPLLGNLFGASPIRPMQKHMAVAVACCKEVLPLFEDMAAGRVGAYHARREAIDQLEHEADAIKNAIRSRLPRRLFLAFERRDMLEVLDQQDSIADCAQDIAGLVDQRSMVIPMELAEPLLELVRKVVFTCEHAGAVIEKLDELVETGFAGRVAGRVEEMINSLNELESETDDIAERAQRKLFSMETELGVSTVFWSQLIIWVGRMADHAEKVGNRLRLLIAS
jgi:predicted phosphate transport protein (TIGR00153 family)